VLSIFAGANGFLDDVPVNKVRQFEEDFLAYVKQKHPQVRQDVTTKGKIDDTFGGEVKKLLTSFKQEYGYTTK
jgi:F-type H+-transporting ATPase subunit alpha